LFNTFFLLVHLFLVLLNCTEECSTTTTLSQPSTLSILYLIFKINTTTSLCKMLAETQLSIKLLNKSMISSLKFRNLKSLLLWQIQHLVCKLDTLGSMAAQDKSLLLLNSSSTVSCWMERKVLTANHGHKPSFLTFNKLQRTELTLINSILSEYEESIFLYCHRLKLIITNSTWISLLFW